MAKIILFFYLSTSKFAERKANEVDIAVLDVVEEEGNDQGTSEEGASEEGGIEEEKGGDQFGHLDFELELDEYEKDALKINSIRKYEVSKLNFKACKYYELFSWITTKLHEPSLTKHLSKEELLDLIDTLAVHWS